MINQEAAIFIYFDTSNFDITMLATYIVYWDVLSLNRRQIKPRGNLRHEKENYFYYLYVVHKLSPRIIYFPFL